MSFIPNYNNQNSIIQNNQNAVTLKNKIEKLKKDIINLKNANSSLKDENLRLKNENQRLKNELNTNNQSLEAYKLKINELNLALTNKNKEIDNLNIVIKNLQLNNKKKFIDVDELLTIQFKSIDQTLDIAFTCQKNDIFINIEEKLYNEYPIYKDMNTYFTVKGHIVERFKSMLDNNIKNYDKIFLNVYE